MVTVTSLIQAKKSNLIVSLDLTDPKEIIKISSLIGEHILAIKLHLDIIDFTQWSQLEFLIKLREKSFLIIEDRKFADIPYIASKQLALVKDYVDIVTLYLISGQEILTEFDKMDVGLLIIYQLSTKGNLLSPWYQHKVREYSDQAKNIVGFISQEPVPGYLTFSPGISLQKISDGIGQQYSKPSSNTDVFIVGRDIYLSSDILESTRRYQNICWPYYSVRPLL